MRSAKPPVPAVLLMSASKLKMSNTDPKSGGGPSISSKLPPKEELDEPYDHSLVSDRCQTTKILFINIYILYNSICLICLPYKYNTCIYCIPSGVGTVSCKDNWVNAYTPSKPPITDPSLQKPKPNPKRFQGYRKTKLDHQHRKGASNKSNSCGCELRLDAAVAFAGAGAGVFAGAFGCVFAAVRGLGFVPRSSEDLDRLTASNFGFAAGLGFGWAGGASRSTKASKLEAFLP